MIKINLLDNRIKEKRHRITWASWYDEILLGFVAIVTLLLAAFIVALVAFVALVFIAFLADYELNQDKLVSLARVCYLLSVMFGAVRYWKRKEK